MAGVFWKDDKKFNPEKSAMEMEAFATEMKPLSVMKDKLEFIKSQLALAQQSATQYKGTADGDQAAAAVQAWSMA